MVNQLFRQSFLYDSLDMETEMMAGQIQLPAGPTLKVLKRGLLELTPAEVTDNTRSVLISAGIHGDETAPMELIDQIITDILQGKLEVKQRCLFMLAHPQATSQNVRFIEENLNRLFDGKKQSETIEAKIVKELKDDVSRFFESVPQSQRWHFDLHSAIRRSKYFTFAMSPKTTKRTRSKALISFVEKARLDAILLANAPSSTFSWYCADTFGAQALTIELGRVSPLGKNDLSLIASFDHALRAFVSDELESLEAAEVIPFRVTQTIKRTQEDFDFNFSDDVENFTEFEHGQVLGHDGEKLLFAKVAHEAVVFPNKNVAIGNRAALMVAEVETRYEDDQLIYD